MDEKCEEFYGELPGDLCCLRSAGGICYEHAKMFGDAGLVQLAESRIRTPQDGVQVSGPAPDFDKQLDDMQKPGQREAMDKAYHTDFEQISRCCK